MPRAATTSDIFNAVAEPRRRQILELLAPGDRSVSDVAKLLCLTQPQASKHLKVLKEVGLVSFREVGRQRYYHLHGEGLKPIQDWVAAFAAYWDDRFERLDEVLEALKARDTAAEAAESERA